MKKLNEFTTEGVLWFKNSEDGHMRFQVEPGRWEVFVNEDGEHKTIVFKAKFQESELDPFFVGGKL